MKFFHHLINPKSGDPQTENEATYVVANTAKEADAWATAVFALGNEAKKYIKRYKLSAIIIDNKKQTKNFDAQLNKML